MNKTFSIQNMETYFRNYVPCKEHNRQPITNFCTQRICLKFMCPQCVQNHSLSHANHPIQSIRTCIRKSSAQIQKTIKQLQQQANKNSFFKYKSPDDYQKQMIRQLQEVRKGLIQQINQYFRQKQSQVKRQTSKTHQIKIKIQSLQSQLSKAIQQLHLIDKNLFVNQQCVSAIKKANKIDYQSLINHFRFKIRQLEKDLDFNLKVQLNPTKRQEFRRILNSLIGIRSNKNRTAQKQKLRTQYKTTNDFRPKYDSPTHQIDDRVEYIVNPPPLSADRIMTQAAFKINYQNYFEGDPFLHFFEVSKPNLHMLPIRNVKQNQPPKWLVRQLDIKFQIPSFHRSIATQSGNVFLIGGTIMTTLQKSKIIYKYQQKQNTLKPISELSVGRSSHSLVCLNKIVYIVGGMGQNDTILKKCQIFNSKTNECKAMSPCKYATFNSTLCSIGRDHLIKLGGVDIEGKNSDYVEIYNIASDFWGQIDPVIEQTKGQFGFLSCSGWGTLNQQQVFIYGGYNQQADNQNSRMSFVFQYKKQNKQFFIKYINMKNLPVAEGFWNPQSVLHNGVIYALQNMDGQAQNDCLEDKRNLLIFNGKQWSTYAQNSI